MIKDDVEEEKIFLKKLLRYYKEDEIPKAKKKQKTKNYLCFVVFL